MVVSQPPAVVNTAEHSTVYKLFPRAIMSPLIINNGYKDFHKGSCTYISLYCKTTMLF